MPGSERAELSKAPNGWVLSGVVDVTYEGSPWHLEYAIECAGDWRTRHVSIVARNGGKAREISMLSEDGAWVTHDDGRMSEHSDLGKCIDVDLGFTPSTNLLPIRRLDLALGTSADVSAAWVKFPDLTLHRLDQRYTRLSEQTYLYESAGGSFRRKLTVNASGFVVDYPDFWRAEAERD